MADKLMDIPNDDTQNSLFCILELWLKRSTLKLMNQLIKILKVPKVESQRIRKD